MTQHYGVHSYSTRTEGEANVHSVSHQWPPPCGCSAVVKLQCPAFPESCWLGVVVSPQMYIQVSVVIMHERNPSIRPLSLHAPPQPH